MICYGSRFSPFVERVWLTARLKGIELRIEHPEGGIKSPSFLAMNPAGKMPVLVDDGFVLPESQVICDYLDAKYPENSIYPSGPRQRAQAMLIARILDTEYYPANAPLIHMIFDGENDPKIIEESGAAIKRAVALIEHFLSGSSCAVGDEWTAADFALMPATYFMKMEGDIVGADFFEDAPKLRALMASWKKTEIYAASFAGWDEARRQFMGMLEAQRKEAAA